MTLQCLSRAVATDPNLEKSNSKINMSNSELNLLPDNQIITSSWDNNLEENKSLYTNKSITVVVEFNTHSVLTPETLMLITKVSVINPLLRSVEQIAHVSLDTGSGKSFITKRLDKISCLKPLITKILALYTFSNGRPKFVSSIQYRGGGGELKCKDTTENIIVNSLPSLTTMLKRKDIDSKNQLVSQWATIDILIGADYFWNIMKDATIKQCKNGYFEINCTLGNFLSGRNNDGNISSVIINATIIRNIKKDKGIINIQPLRYNVESFWDSDITI